VWEAILMGLICSPACKCWVFLSKDKAVCNHSERRVPDGRQFGLMEGEYCEYGEHINARVMGKEFCDGCGSYHPDLGGWCDEKQALMPPDGTCKKFKVVEG
jgi:hypothetical protein